MKTTDLFKNNRSSKKINESLQKTFGRKLNLENFDLEQLQDARNKLRTQVSQVRSESGFNENLENEAFTEAQWMLDAINAEIAEREEHIVNNNDVEENFGPLASRREKSPNSRIYDLYMDGMDAEEIGRRLGIEDTGMIQDVIDQIEVNGGEPIGEVAPPTAKAERMVKHIKAGYAKDGKLTDKEKSIAYATAWKQHNKEKNEDIDEEQVDELKRSTVKSYAVKKMDRVKSNNPSTLPKVGKDLKGLKNAQARLSGERPTSESIESGEDMTRLNEGEIQQAQSIVTAKTMVDRVGRWIEELSGMENDTLLQLGDQIRDEMSADQAKIFISTVAPAIQQALEALKGTRETLATGVRTLTGEEQAAQMIGAEPTAGAEGPVEPEMGAAEPDAMNAEPDLGGAPEDEFGASEAGAGGLETAGRMKRESIDRSNRLLKVLAG